MVLFLMLLLMMLQLVLLLTLLMVLLQLVLLKCVRLARAVVAVAVVVGMAVAVGHCDRGWEASRCFRAGWWCAMGAVQLGCGREIVRRKGYIFLFHVPLSGRRRIISFN